MRPPKGMGTAEYNRAKEIQRIQENQQRNNYRTQPRFNVRVIVFLFIVLAIGYVLVAGYLQPMP